MDVRNQATLPLLYQKGADDTEVIADGSRLIMDYELVSEAIEESPWNPTAILTGDARGMDALAQEWAKENGRFLYVSEARWWEHGNAA